MKPGLIYTIIFMLLFLLVTGGMYYIADTQPELLIVHIPGIASEEANPHDTSHVKQKAMRIELLEDQIPEEDYYSFLVDTTKKIPREKVIEVKHDTIVKNVKYQDPALLDSIASINKDVSQYERDLVAKDKEIKKLQNRIRYGKDSTYQAWLKKTVKLYESLKPQQAAKLISNRTDNEARDLLYAMKQKKAAAILSQLNDSLATVLTRSR